MQLAFIPAGRARASCRVAGLLTLGLVAALSTGCATLESRGSHQLFSEARAAFTQEDYETAYRHAKQLDAQYPKSAEKDDAFSIAAQSLKVLYYRDQFTQPDSVWVASEPQFMFAWVASYSQGDFPTDAANALLAGLPYGVFHRFQAFARTHPDLSQWSLRAKDDNGIVHSVSTERAF